MSEVLARLPEGWRESADELIRDGEYDLLPLRLPPDVTRVSATLRLALQAEFGGWEISRVRRYPDGTRKVLLKRKKPVRPALEQED
ncbi:DUF5703 family protein [Smaragdicoccus niigatensis]|uniref:DUF5703 family protein n=1 Tax=Smaragdicoccus niigatensis TaxID=359359 RepID=UPI000376D517|nr:DUF5703 family protein [Smaragdicoccus niigatensis]